MMNTTSGNATETTTQPSIDSVDITVAVRMSYDLDDPEWQAVESIELNGFESDGNSVDDAFVVVAYEALNPEKVTDEIARLALDRLGVKLEDSDSWAYGAEIDPERCTYRAWRKVVA